MPSQILIDLTADIVSVHTENNTVAAAELPILIQSVYAALAGLGQVAAPKEQLPEPAVSVRTSVKPDTIACLDCGLKFKTLKRHLSNAHGLTPADYRDRWNLRSDYPMIAPSYATVRSKLAVKAGLGRKSGQMPTKLKAPAAGKPAAAMNPAGAPKVAAKPKSAATPEGAAAKPIRRKKLGLFNGGQIGAAPES